MTDFHRTFDRFQALIDARPDIEYFNLAELEEREQTITEPDAMYFYSVPVYTKDLDGMGAHYGDLQFSYNVHGGLTIEIVDNWVGNWSPDWSACK